jgi:nucleoside-diphosphate-sugar epimerase
MKPHSMVSASSWKGGKVLITGTTGFLGRHLAAMAAEAGAVVITTSRSETKAGIAGHIAIDLCDRDQVSAMLKEVAPSGILHTAAAGASEKADFAQLMQTNVLGTENLLAAALALPHPPAVVLAGSGYEYAPQSRDLTEDDLVCPVTPYGISKAAAAFCAGVYATRMPITLLRIFNVYGPGEQEPRLLPYVAACAKAQRIIELTDCEQVRDFVFVKDVAALFWRALERSPQDRRLRILNVGSGSPAPLKRFVAVLLEILREKGLNPRVKFGVRPRSVGEPMYYAADTSRLRETLDKLPGTSLQVGIRQTLDAIL